MSLNLPEKRRKIKTSVDIDYELLFKAHAKMKKRGHKFREIVEAALKQYIEEQK
jgi:hypothetical protein